MSDNARGGYDAVKKFAEANVKCLDATPFLPHKTAKARSGDDPVKKFAEANVKCFRRDRISSIS